MTAQLPLYLLPRLPESAERACSFCGEGFEESWAVTHWMLDVVMGDGECFIRFFPCCVAMRDMVGWDGYEAATGRTVQAVVTEITGREVLEVIGQGDGTVVCRLRTVDPTVLHSTDSAGHKKARSPKGWQSQIFADVEAKHRHHDAPQGWKFGVAVYNGGVKVGVATVGRPVSRHIQAAQPHTLEVTRVCTWGAAPLRKNAVSKLYAAAAERARSMGYRRLITYTMHGVESGESLLASGWTPTHISDGGSWRRPARPNASESAPTGRKVRWGRGLCKSQRKAVRRAAITIA